MNLIAPTTCRRHGPSSPPISPPSPDALASLQPSDTTTNRTKRPPPNECFTNSRDQHPDFGSHLFHYDRTLLECRRTNSKNTSHLFELDDFRLLHEFHCPYGAVGLVLPELDTPEGPHPQRPLHLEVVHRQRHDVLSPTKVKIPMLYPRPPTTTKAKNVLKISNY